MTNEEWTRELDILADYASRRRGFMILADGVPLDLHHAVELGGYDFITVYPTHVAAKNEIYDYRTGRARLGLEPDTREMTIVRVMYPQIGEIVPPPDYNKATETAHMPASVQ